MDPYVLFNVRSNKPREDSKFVSATVIVADDPRPTTLGYCCVVDKTLLKNEGDLIKVFFPFAHNMFAGSESHRVTTESFLHVKDSCWLDTHKVVRVETFDIEKFGALRNTIENNHNVSLIIKGDEGIEDFMKKLPQMIAKFEFGINHMLCRRMVNAKFKPSLALSFLNLKDCIPIINPNKVDGLGLSIALFDEEQSIEAETLVAAVKGNVIFTNYKDNILVVDGVKEDKKMVDYAIIKRYLRDSMYSVNEILLGNKKPNKPEKRKNYRNETKTDNNTFYYSISTSSSSNSSSTTSGWS